jgi:hypothetical protein
MAFCTSCGAAVSGAFCTGCGRPVDGSAASPQVSQPVVAPVPPPLAEPVKRKTSPLVWVLIVVLGIGVIGAAAVGVGIYLASRVGPRVIEEAMRSAGKDVEILDRGADGSSFRIRDKRTGKIATFSMSDLRQGKLSFDAEGDNGETAHVEFGGSAASVPSWVPRYPGAQIQGVVSASGANTGNEGAGGAYHFQSTDSSSKVLDWYNGEARKLGLSTRTAGAVLAAGNEGEGRSLTVTANSDGSGSAGMVVYKQKP